MDYKAALLAAMAASEPDPTLPEKTIAERKAGRSRIEISLRESVLEVGRAELKRRFGAKSIGPAALWFDGPSDKWVAGVVVHTAADTVMNFCCPLLEFPDEYMLAQIALVT